MNRLKVLTGARLCRFVPSGQRVPVICGGYARAIQTSATTDRFAFYYYNKDHLGNNRELETSTGTIYQVTDY